jgi:peroxiredoxin
VTPVPRLAIGDSAPPFVAATLAGGRVAVPSRERVVHLQFRRFAGCPICNLHVRSFARRVDELGAAGIQEIVFFHSRPETMARYQADLPMDVVADPERAIYDQYGVSRSARLVLDPRAWPTYLRGVFARHPSSTFVGEGGHTGLPADFLIDRTGAITARKYGVHANDHWSVDHVLGLASASVSADTVEAPRQGDPG